MERKILIPILVIVLVLISYRIGVRQGRAQLTGAGSGTWRVYSEGQEKVVTI